MKYLIGHSVLFGRMGALSIILSVLALLIIAWRVMNVLKLRRKKKELEEAVKNDIQADAQSIEPSLDKDNKK